MKIAIIRGSNSILKHSYTKKLEQNNYNIKNYDIGATNIIYVLNSLLKMI